MVKSLCLTWVIPSATKLVSIEVDGVPFDSLPPAVSAPC